MSTISSPVKDAPVSTETVLSQQAKPQSQPKAAVQAKEAAAPTGTGEPKKLTNAELKLKAKAEKAARRAQAVQGKPGAVVPQASAPASSQNTESGKGAKPRSLEIRNQVAKGAAQKTSLPSLPKPEDKTVDFFRHLYKTRTTTIAGAGKEVHPAVLALGLQMSNYTICGSCARLVATIQAFKRVRQDLLLLHSCSQAPIVIQRSNSKCFPGD